MVDNSKTVIVVITHIKEERPDLVAKFSKYAITEIVKDKIDLYGHYSGDIDFITAKCIISMEDLFVSEHRRLKKLLQNCLENDCEYSPEKIKEMTPRQKVKNWLEYYGIQGYTDDILDVVSAAYGTILEPDLNR